MKSILVISFLFFILYSCKEKSREELVWDYFHSRVERITEEKIDRIGLSGLKGELEKHYKTEDVQVGISTGHLYTAGAKTNYEEGLTIIFPHIHLDSSECFKISQSAYTKMNLELFPGDEIQIASIGNQYKFTFNELK